MGVPQQLGLLLLLLGLPGVRTSSESGSAPGALRARAGGAGTGRARAREALWSDDAHSKAAEPQSCRAAE